MRKSVWLSAVAVIGFALFVANFAIAHCDTAAGPVIPEAKAALEKGDVTPLLKWVSKNDEVEIMAAFAKAVAERAAGPEAQELADQHFLETLVRVHRAGEGAPYTGIKDEPVAKIVAMADKALADGSADDLIAKMSGHMATAVREKFTRVLETAKHKDDSVDAGREYVEAYVVFMHYVEGVHDALKSGGGHEHAAPATDKPVQTEHAH